MKYRKLSIKFLTCAVFIFFLDGYVLASGANGNEIVNEVIAKEKAYNESFRKYDIAKENHETMSQRKKEIHNQIILLSKLENVVTKAEYKIIETQILDLMSMRDSYASQLEGEESQQQGLKTLMEEAFKDYQLKKKELEGARKNLNDFAKNPKNNQQANLNQSIRIANGDEIASKGNFAKCEEAEFVSNFARRKIIFSASMIKKMAVAQCDKTSDLSLECRVISQGKENSFPSVCSTYVKCTNKGETVLRRALCEDLDCDDVARKGSAMKCVNDGSARGIDLDKNISTIDSEIPVEKERGSITL